MGAVVRGLGVSETLARKWVEVGEVSLGLPSYRDRLREAAREVVARDRRGETLESVERRGFEARVADRARALEAGRKAERKVLGDAVAQRAEEAKLVRGVRQTATAMLTAEAHLLRAAIQLGESISADVSSGKLAAMKTTEKTRLVRDIASIVKATAETARLAVTTERTILGKPGSVLGPDLDAEDMSPEEAEAYVEMASRAIRRRAAKRTVIDTTSEVAE